MDEKHNIPNTTCIYLKEHDGYCRYMYDEIYYIEASGSYCNVYISGEKTRKILLAMSLLELNEFLPPKIFIRTHRTFIVNINHIERIIGNLIYIGKEVIPMGREHKKDVMAILNIVG